MEWLNEPTALIPTATNVELLWLVLTLPGAIFVMVLLGMRIQYRVSGVGLAGSERMARSNNIILAVLLVLIFLSMLTLGLLAVFTRPSPTEAGIAVLLLILMVILLDIMVAYYVLSTFRLRAQVNREDEQEGGFIHSQEHAESHAQLHHTHSEHSELPQSGMKGKHNG